MLNEIKYVEFAMDEIDTLLALMLIRCGNLLVYT
jgi:hypothetical protein